MSLALPFPLSLSISTYASEPEPDASSTNSSEPPSPTPQQSDTHFPAPSGSTSTLTHTTASAASASASSLPATSLSLNVKFAPLPEIAPRRRRSTAPLGMAARSQLLRRRRGNFAELEEQAAALDETWTREMRVQHRLNLEAAAARFALYQAEEAALAAREEEAELELMECELELSGGDGEKFPSKRKRRKRRGGGGGGGGRSGGAVVVEDLDEPFLALSKTLKGVWRRVSSTTGKDERDATSGSSSSSSTENESEVTVRRSGPDLGPWSGDSSQPLRPILATIRSHSNIAAAAAASDKRHQQQQEPNQDEEPEVWNSEREIGDIFPLNVSQTETVLEGRPVKSASAPTRTATDPVLSTLTQP